ncbi:hypothetical protein LMG26219_04849 [Achromobacter marplatensis]|nr:hypothetical protein LMG26219_04849 [Achromobacter marplatensis]
MDIAVLGEFRARDVDAVTQGAVTQVHDLAGVVLAIDRQGDGVTDLDVAADLAGHGDILAGFFGVDDAVAGDRVDGNGGIDVGVDAVALIGFSGLAVAGVVGRGDGGVDVGILSEFRTRDIDAVAQGTVAQIHHLTGVVLAIDGQGDGVAHLDVAADLTGHGDILAGFFGVDDAVASDRVDRDRSIDVRVDAVALVRFSGLAVAGVIGRRDGGMDVGVLSEFRTRNIDAVAQGAVTQIHDLAGVVLAVDGQGDGVADLDVAADLTGDGNVLARFFGVDHAVAGDRVDRDRGVDLGVDAVALIGFSGLAVAGVIGRRDGGVDVGILSEFRTRDIDAVAQGTVAQIHDLTGVVLAIDGQGDGVAHLDVTADLTGHGNVLARFFGVHHAVAGDHVDRDRSVDRGINVVALIGLGCRRVAGVVGRRHGGMDVRVLGQFRTGNIDAVTQRTVTQVHDLAGVVLAIDGQGDGVTDLDVATDLTGDGNVLARFFGVHHAVAGDRVNGDLGLGGQGVDDGGSLARQARGARFVGIAAVRHLDGHRAFIVRLRRQIADPLRRVGRVRAQIGDLAVVDHHVRQIKTYGARAEVERDGAITVDGDDDRGPHGIGQRRRGVGVVARQAIAGGARRGIVAAAGVRVCKIQRGSGFQDASQADKTAAAGIAATRHDGGGGVQFVERIAAGLQRGQQAIGIGAAGRGDGRFGRIRQGASHVPIYSDFTAFTDDDRHAVFHLKRNRGARGSDDVAAGGDFAALMQFRQRSVAIANPSATGDFVDDCGGRVGHVGSVSGSYPRWPDTRGSRLRGILSSRTVSGSNFAPRFRRRGNAVDQ